MPAFDPDNISELFHDPGKHAFDPVLDGRQYVPILGAWINIAIQALNNFDPSAHERFHFLKVVGRKSYVGDTKESENVRRTQIRIVTDDLTPFVRPVRCTKS